MRFDTRHRSVSIMWLLLGFNANTQTSASTEDDCSAAYSFSYSRASTRACVYAIEREAKNSFPFFAIILSCAWLRVALFDACRLAHAIAWLLWHISFYRGIKTTNDFDVAHLFNCVLCLACVSHRISYI